MLKDKFSTGLFVAFCLLLLFSVFRSCNKLENYDQEILNRNKILKDSIVLLINESKLQRKYSDSLENDIKSFSYQYEAQKKRLTMITSKYERLRYNHLSYTSVSAVNLLTRNLATDTID